MPADILLGLQWGDEGKGKIVDYLAAHYDIVARFQGGPNAGHTLKVNGENFVLHTIPSGILHPRVKNVIGNGVVIDPITLKKELEKIKKSGADISENLFISNRAQLILPTHKLLDAASEAKKGEEKIGSTLRGIGPAYMDKTGRNGLRVGDIELENFRERYHFLKEKHYRLMETYDYSADVQDMEEEWFEGIEALRSIRRINTEYFLNDELKKGRRLLAEGAQGTMLDLDFGTYPYVTSSNTISASACKGLGIAPSYVREVIGVSKAYCTRVGGGPFPTELQDATGERIRQIGGEFGATTGRPRRCGWLDLPALKYSAMLNGLTQLVLTKADVLNDFEEIKVCTHYQIGDTITDELPFDLCRIPVKPVYRSLPGWKLASGPDFSGELPDTLNDFIELLESYLMVPVTIVSHGPHRHQLILRKQPAAV
ncbi:MAG: adenylosuccinate synthetase [Chitinophagales bacterium]|nr:MAG: adenylosuccinate synthetase [Chitinophagales bacterium]